MTDQVSDQAPDQSPDQTPHQYPAPGVEPGPAPRDWSMLMLILTVIAALGFGGTAMMYQRAAASKRTADANAALAIAERDRAETALKDANTQRRLAEDAKARADRAAEAEARVRAESQPPAPAPAPASSKPEPASKPTSGTLPPARIDRAASTPTDMRAVLDASAKELDAGKLKNDPLAAGGVHSTLGRTYLSLGEYAKAAAQLQKAIDLRKPKLGGKNPDVVKDQESLDKARRSLPR